MAESTYTARLLEMDIRYLLCQTQEKADQFLILIFLRNRNQGQAQSWITETYRLSPFQIQVKAGLFPPSPIITIPAALPEVSLDRLLPLFPAPLFHATSAILPSMALSAS